MKRLGIFTTLAMLVMAVSASVALGAIQVTFNPANAPSGTHVQTGTPNCTVTNGSVSCNAFELAGVGNTNAVLNLVANYTATIDCRNHGGKVVESHSQTIPVGAGPVTLTSSKNGRLAVPARGITAPSAAQFLATATCPNPNWTPEVRQGTSITLLSFTYTITFAGFNQPYLTITGP